MKYWEQGISTMRARVDKHLSVDSVSTSTSNSVKNSSSSTSSSENNIKSRVWTALTDRVVEIVKQLQQASLASYQIALDVSHEKVQKMFEK